MDSSHRRHDLRSLALHQEAVRVLREHPEKAERALEVLDKWEAQNLASNAQPLLDEWRRIIAGRLWDLATEDSEKGQQLRQASPLGFVLEPGVRERIFQAFRRAEKPVIFLDLDGCCHPVGTARLSPLGDIEGEGLFRWAPTLMALLDELPDVDVVLHSSWRNLFETDDELRAVLPPGLALRVVACTPREVASRYESIQAYIARHRVQRFVIVDDEAAAFPEGVENLVVVQAAGLDDPGTIDAIRRAFL